MQEVDEQMLNVQNNNSSYFVEWIPNNVSQTGSRVVGDEDKWRAACRQGHELHCRLTSSSTRHDPY